MSERSIFLALLDIDDPSERADYLDRACAGDPGLRDRVEQLLKAHQGPGRFMERPAPDLLATADEVPPAERPGTVIGPYKLLEQIGEGGFGVVFMAEQTQPVRRKVALKVLKPGMDTRQVVARFEAERQALALMDHPNIARVFDGGATPSGRPYFVMELIRGVSLTDFCDQGQLSIRERLGLFVGVCQAVQHAHQKGVIHRDLKPSNVLVTLHDDRPVVKVIDFGIAKALGQELTDKTVFTHFAQMVGTPLYMSPEQAGMSGLDADTRTDIYSLGVLLYELLTGTTPFDRERFRQVGYDELRRIIREEEPPRPSTRLSTLGQAATTVSARRQADPKALSRLFRGELDWVVMKALEKDRNRRYESAGAFAADVRRYLHDEPVLACPPTAWYRFRKFARRNRAALLTASGVALATVLAVVLLAVSNAAIRREQRDKDRALLQKDEALAQEKAASARERAQKERADRNREKAVEAVWNYSNLTAEDPRLKAADLHALRKDLLQTAVPFYEDFVKQKGDDPALEAKRGMAYYSLAYVRAEIGEGKQALADYERARVIFAGLAGRRPARPRERQLLAYCHNALGNELLRLGKRDEARTAYGRALAAQKELADRFPRDPHYRLELAGTHNNLGKLFREAGEPARAEGHHREAFTLRLKLARDFPGLPQCRRDLARSHVNLAVLHNAQGRRAEAEPHYRRAVEIDEGLVKQFPGTPDYRADLANAHDGLAGQARAAGRWDQAETHYRKALDAQEKLAGDFPSVPLYRQALAHGHTLLGQLLRDRRKPVEAETHYRKALDLRQKLADDFPGVPEHVHELARSHNDLGLLLRDRGRRDEAEAAFRRAVALTRKVLDDFPPLPEYHNGLGMWLNNLALLRMDQGRLEEARDFLNRAILNKQAAVKASPSNAGYRLSLRTAYLNLGDVLEGLRQGDAAEAACRRALEVLQEAHAELRSLPGAQSDLGATLNDLSMLLMRRGKLAEARRLLEQAVTHQRAALRARPRHPTYRLFLRHHYVNLAVALLRLGEHAEAAGVADKLSGVFPDDPANWYEAAGVLALCVSLAEKDTTQTTEGRARLAKSYGDRAMRMLHAAVEKGFKHAEDMKRNANLNPLRSRDDFKKLLAELEARGKQ